MPYLNTFLIDFQVPGKRAGLLLATSRNLLPWDDSKTTAKYDLRKNVIELQGFYTKSVTLPEYLLMDKDTRDYQLLDSL